VKDTITALGIIYVTLMVLSLLIPSFLLDRDDRREAKRKARGVPET
jgi:uncharacterized membrane protein YsdA (DUF1294 family)